MTSMLHTERHNGDRSFVMPTTILFVSLQRTVLTEHCLLPPGQTAVGLLISQSDDTSDCLNDCGTIFVASNLYFDGYCICFHIGSTVYRPNAMHTQAYCIHTCDA